MDIIRTTKFEDTWHRGIPRLKALKRVVIHGTAGIDNVTQLLDWMVRGGDGRHHKYKQSIGFFHFAIDKNGTILQLIDTDRWMYHSHSGVYDEESIGIELCNRDIKNRNPYTPEQYTSLIWLLFEYLISRNPITEITGHERMMQKYSKSTFRKNGYRYYCPGNFDWAQLALYMDQNDIPYKMRHNIPESFWDVGVR